MKKKNNVKKRNIFMVMGVMLLALTGCEANSDLVKLPSHYLKEESVKEIILDHSTLNENDIGEYEVELERKDNTPIYHIEFTVDGFKYEYRLNAVTGEMIEYEKKSIGNKTEEFSGERNELEEVEENEKKKDLEEAEEDNKKEDKISEEERLELEGNLKISEAEAIAIALKNVGMSQEDVVFVTAYVTKYEREFAYHVKFKTKDNDTVYDYVISAIDGDILLSEKH